MSLDVHATGTGLQRLRESFPAGRGYLNAATLGLPAAGTVDAVRAALRDWQDGRASPLDYDDAVTASRRSYARIVNASPDRVSVGSQASVAVALAAAALPDGAEVVVVEGDFTSVVFPFLVHADRGVRVRHVPLEALADAVRPGTALVAYSLVQSADGRVADAAAVREAAVRAGALTLCDVTQAVGWLPVAAQDHDMTVCSAYKWLSCPRGVAFTTTSPGLTERLRPLHAGWYAGESVWGSTYGPAMSLAGDARRFDVSPAWLAWCGAAPVLDLFAAADLAQVHRHDVTLADDLLARLDRPPGGSAVVALPDPDGAALAALTAAGCVVAGRAGRVRIAFHLWNDSDDVRRAAEALASTSRRRLPGPDAGASTAVR